MEETTTKQILVHFVSLFYHINEFKNSIIGFYTTQAKYLYNKLK